ncbi:hypothetical protein P3T36_007337 [Kitasatospora sp. MAP12-15]|nr:hypothetical protein [Kitasatospora sp. MAP12-44]
MPGPALAQLSLGQWVPLDNTATFDGIVNK